MPIEDNNLLAPLAGQFFEFPAQVNFFAGEELLIEPAHLTKRAGFAKDARARHVAHGPADMIPQLGATPAHGGLALDPQARASGQAAARLDLHGHVREQFRGGIRVGVNEEQPIPERRLGGRVAGAPNLVDRLEDDPRAADTRQFGGVIRRIVVANDQFGFPAQIQKGLGRRLDALQHSGQQFLLVEGRNKDRDLHSRCNMRWIA